MGTGDAGRLANFLFEGAYSQVKSWVWHLEHEGRPPLHLALWRWQLEHAFGRSAKHGTSQPRRTQRQCKTLIS